MYPICVAIPQFLQVVYCDIYKRVKTRSYRRDGRCSSLYKQRIFDMFLQK